MDPRQDQLQEQEPAAGSATTYEALNADCWRLVLDHLTIKEVVRSERVSRDWQRVVLDYLAGVAGVHNLRIETTYHSLETTSNLPRRYNLYRSVTLRRYSRFFDDMIQKLGPFAVSMVANYIDKETLNAIVRNCPNLEELTIHRTMCKCSLDQLTRCQKLKRIVFIACPRIDDDCLNGLMASGSLEELAINRSPRLTGSFLANLRKDLKTLILDRCDSLLMRHVQSAVDHLTGLTRLELNSILIETLEDRHLLLDRMPELQYLAMMGYDDDTRTSRMGFSGVVSSFDRLARLRELHLWGNTFSGFKAISPNTSFH